MQRQESANKSLKSSKIGLSIENSKQQLVKLWSQKKVDACYQNMVLSYLNCMEPDKASQQIQKQKEKTVENKTQFQKFKQLRMGRQQILSEVLKSLEDENNIQQACQNLDKLRIINLKICQLILSIKLTLQKRQLNQDALYEGFGKYLSKLNLQNRPIINSYMKKYIQFGMGYDPFFLNPYQKIQSEGIHQDMPQPIIRLFKMNVSYVYRLIKARNQISECLKLNPNVANQISQRISENEKQQQQQHYRQQAQPISNSAKRLKRKIKIPKKYQTINYEEYPEGVKNSSLRVQSQPKKSLRNSINLEQLQKVEKPKYRKFKMRQVETQKTNPYRFKTQFYDLAEDQDINAFRKKMLARRRARKNKLIIDTRKLDQDQLQQQKNLRAKRHSLQFKKNQIVFNEVSKIQKKSGVQQLQQNQSQEQQIMESRNLQHLSKTQKTKLFQSGRFRTHIRRRNDKIKLQPILRSKYNEPSHQNRDQGDQQQRQFLHLHLDNRRQISDQKRIKSIYYPLSPQIKQMNKESSSAKSQKQQSQQQQNQSKSKIVEKSLQSVERKNEDKKTNTSNINFRIKKIEISEKNKEENNEYKQYTQSHSIKDELNQKKFRDGHIRKQKVQQDQIAKIKKPESRLSNNIQLKNFDRNQNQTFESANLNNNNTQSKRQKISRLQINKFLQARQQKSSQTSQVKDNQHPPTYRYRNQTQSNYPSEIAPHRIASTNKILDQIQQMEQNKNKKKQVQLKPGQINIDDLFSFIQRQKINQFQRKQFQVGLWKQNITLKHSYLTKFYLNSELAAFGISSPRCDGDFSILYWGTTCTQNFTFFLFKKYLDYLQKFTNLNNIYIGTPQYSQADFIKKGSNYVRKRKIFQKRTLPYIPFLSLQCSNICFQQNNQNSIFYSQQIQQFSSKNCTLNSIIGQCKPKQSIDLPCSTNFHQNISSIASVNNILEKLQIDTYATSQKIQIKQCRIFTFKDNCTIKSNYFYIRDGYFAPKGIQVYSKEKEKIMRLQMNKQQYHLFFGKKIQNIQSFVSNCSLKPGPDCFFAFKMFSKQLYGRLRNKQFQSLGCYGNWDINFLWQDQLKGTVIKEMPTNQYIYGPENFYVALFKSETFLFAFEVKSSDFFF